MTVSAWRAGLPDVKAFWLGGAERGGARRGGAWRADVVAPHPPETIPNKGRAEGQVRLQIMDRSPRLNIENFLLEISRKEW